MGGVGRVKRRISKVGNGPLATNACTERPYCTPKQRQVLKPAVCGSVAHQKKRWLGLAWEHE